MSVLEIVLYITLGIATFTYVVVTIVKTFKRKKNKNETKRDADDMQWCTTIPWMHTL